MSYSNFFGQNGGENEEKVVDTAKERKGIRQKIRSDLKHKLKFTNTEIQEIIDIIDRSEREIDFLRNSMIGMNINNDNAEADTIRVTRDIREEGERMALNIKQKTAEILLRKRKQ